MKKTLAWKLFFVSCLLLIALKGMTSDCTPVHAAKLPALKVEGTRLVNAKGRPVQLKGVSTHGLSWFPGYVDQKAFKDIKKIWKADAVRLALYTSDYNGYCSGDAANRSALEQRIDKGVQYATKSDPRDPRPRQERGHPHRDTPMVTGCGYRGSLTHQRLQKPHVHPAFLRRDPRGIPAGQSQDRPR